MAKIDLLQYKVPQLSPDGTCSIGSALADRPYDLRDIFETRGDLPAERQLAAQVRKLYALITETLQNVDADWFGVYQAITKRDGARVLVKLMYEGKPSRAEFPLTKDFALLSNNTRVGLSGEEVIIRSVARHDGAYYTCDAEVQSEACLPIFDKNGGTVVGIIDAEAFDEGHFTDERLNELRTLCRTLSDHLPISIKRN